MSFGPLRVFNEDVVAPGNGFPLHPHREMEIVTYLIDGELEHRDSAGNHGVISPGEVQRMSAGTGIRHSEFNPSDKTPAHLVQLWIEPGVAHLAPSWEQKSYPLAARSGKLLPIAVPAGKNGQRPAHAVEIPSRRTILSGTIRMRAFERTSSFTKWSLVSYGDGPNTFTLSKSGYLVNGDAQCICKLVLMLTWQFLVGDTLGLLWEERGSSSGGVASPESVDLKME